MKGIPTLLLSLGMVLALSSITEANLKSFSPGLFFDVAKGRPIQSSATCGETATGNSERQEFCILAGSINNNDGTGGQYCGQCEKGADGADHSAKYALDRSPNRWWQSPSLARGGQFHEVNVTIDLEQMFEIFYVHLKMGNSPRPKVWALERSVDNGKTFQAWKYFASDKSECELYFGPESTTPMAGDDSVRCNMHSSRIIPLENGEILINLAENRNWYESKAFQQFVRATHIRFRFLRLNTLQGHLEKLAKHDPAVTKRYFYSIQDIEIAGRCICNGHAESCSPVPENPKEMRCACENNTCGNQCQTCCESFDGYPSCTATVPAIEVKKNRASGLGWLFPAYKFAFA